MKKRKKLLIQLITLQGEITTIVNRLSEFPWDCAEPLVNISPINIKKILLQFQSNEISAEQLEAWANSIECRDDIGFDCESEEVLRSIIFTLANPLLTKQISIEYSDELLAKISKISSK